MKTKKIIIVGIVVMAIVLGMQAVAITNLSNTPQSPKKTLELTKIEEPVRTGGPIKVKCQSIDPDFLGTPQHSLSLMGTDRLVTGFPEYEGNPVLTIDNQGTLLLAYEYEQDFLEQDALFTYSKDLGATWQDSIGFQIDGRESHPSAEYAGMVEGTNRAYATFLSSAGQGAQTTLVNMIDVFDPETWEGATYVWDDSGFYEFNSCDLVAFHDPIPIGTEEAEHFVAAFIGSFSGLSGYPDCVQTPHYMVDIGGGQGWIYWFYYNNSANVKMDIDKPGEMIYYTFQWGNNGNQDVIVLSTDLENVGVTEDEGGWGDGMGEDRKYQITGTANTINPAIAADNNNVYLLLQSDQDGNQDIVCYYSSDGGAIYDMSVVADTSADEMYPAVTANGKNAVCVFIKNNNLYSATTQDGGVSWKINNLPINDVDGSVMTQYGAADVSGNYGVWTDNRNGNGDIYLDETTSAPLVMVKDISGGFGVSAEITNEGTADASDVEWAMTFDVPLMILPSDGETRGTISSLAVGTSETVSSGLVLGFGKGTITVTVDGASKSVSGFVVGPFVLGVS